ncbi:unnamed protein product, partial [Mesorhabditis spiculigera]
MDPVASSFLVSIHKMLEMNSMVGFFNVDAHEQRKEIAVAMSAIGSSLDNSPEPTENLTQRKLHKKVNLEKKIDFLIRVRNLGRQDDDEQEDGQKPDSDDPANYYDDRPSATHRFGDVPITMVGKSEPVSAADLAGKPFVCAECGARFTRKAGVRRHCRSIHSSERIQCPFEKCTIGFRSEKMLEQHTRNAHGSPQHAKEKRKRRKSPLRAD